MITWGKEGYKETEKLKIEIEFVEVFLISKKPVPAVFMK